MDELVELTIRLHSNLTVLTDASLRPREESAGRNNTNWDYSVLIKAKPRRVHHQTAHEQSLLLLPRPRQTICFPSHTRLHCQSPLGSSHSDRTHCNIVIGPRTLMCSFHNTRWTRWPVCREKRAQFSLLGWASTCTDTGRICGMFLYRQKISLSMSRGTGWTESLHQLLSWVGHCRHFISVLEERWRRPKHEVSVSGHVISFKPILY